MASVVRVLGKDVKRMGMGLMNMTWGTVHPQTSAIQVIKTAYDNGIRVFNTATFYETPEQPLAGVKLAKAFFDAHPECIDSTVLCIKGGMIMSQHKLSGEINFLRADLKQIKDALGVEKKLDIYVISRIPKDVTLEELMENLKVLKSEGYFNGVGLSEASAATIRKAHAIHPISAVENELSLFCLEPEILDSLKACTDLGIPFTAYSPLGRGMLTMRYKSYDELPENDIRRLFPRFQGENFDKNLELAKKVESIAKAKGVTSAQLALAYIMKLSPQVIPLQGSSNAERVVSNVEATNVRLSDEDVADLQKILASFEIAGTRTPAAVAALTMQ